MAARLARGRWAKGHNMLSNQQMKAGRFLRRQEGKRKLAWINEQFAKGLTVSIHSQTRVWVLHSKHAELVTIDAAGALFLQSGKSKFCVDYCGIRAGVLRR